MVSRCEEPKNRTIGFCWKSNKSLTHRIRGTCMFTYIYLHEWFTIHESYANMTRFHWKGMCLINIHIESKIRICVSMNDLWMTHEWPMNDLWIYIFIIYIYIETRTPFLDSQSKSHHNWWCPSVPSSKVAFALCGAREVDYPWGFHTEWMEFL